MNAGIFGGVIATQEFAIGLSQLGTDGSNPSPSAGESVRTGLARLRGGPERYRRLLRPLNGGPDSASAEPAAISTR
jgi:hypothetical protein